MSRKGVRVLYLVTEDWYFCSHRLALGRAARAAGYAVTVATRVDRHGEVIRAAGLDLVPIAMRRRGRNPFTEGRAVWELFRLYCRLRPQVVHHVAMKPVVYGSLAALLAGVPLTVNAIAGMGHVFIARDVRMGLLRLLLGRLFRFFFNRPGCRVIIQNDDDRRFLEERLGVGADRIALIRGSGVDPAEFPVYPEPTQGPLTVTMVSRMLWTKGVGELVAAARLLRQQGVAVRVVLVGKSDPDNPAAIPEDNLRAWQAEGIIEWWGHREDIAEVWRQSHMAVLPSYQEGLPKALLEAAACGRPIVTTDVPGCREVVVEGENGYLVPVRQAEGLADAIGRLAADPQGRAEMGRRSRQRVEAHFSAERVIAATLALYPAPGNS